MVDEDDILEDQLDDLLDFDLDELADTDKTMAANSHEENPDDDIIDLVDLAKSTDAEKALDKDMANLMDDELPDEVTTDTVAQEEDLDLSDMDIDFDDSDDNGSTVFLNPMDSQDGLDELDKDVKTSIDEGDIMTGDLEAILEADEPDLEQDVIPSDSEDDIIADLLTGEDTDIPGDISGTVVDEDSGETVMTDDDIGGAMPEMDEGGLDQDPELEGEIDLDVPIEGMDETAMNEDDIGAMFETDEPIQEQVAEPEEAFEPEPALDDIDLGVTPDVETEQEPILEEIVVEAEKPQDMAPEPLKEPVTPHLDNEELMNILEERVEAVVTSVVHEVLEKVAREAITEVVERVTRETMTEVAEKVLTDTIDALTQSLESDTE